jgi:hypothetical protein
MKVSLVQAVKDYAEEHYEEGWDIVVEAMDNVEIATVIHGAPSPRMAIYKMSKYVKDYKAYGDDIRGS